MSITDEIERLVELFEEIERYIMQMVADIIIKNPGAHSLVYWKRRAQGVHAELASLRSELLKTTPDVVAHSYSAGYTAGAGGRGHAQATQGVNARAIALLAAGMNDKLDASLQTVGRRVDDTFRRAGLKSAALHATTGTAHEIARKQMTKDLQKQGVGAFVDKAGRTWTLKSYTSMVVRTTTREAMSQGSFQSMEDYGTEIVKVSHHESAKKCKICAPLDGRVFAMPNAPDHIKALYPTLERIPPFHPNCKHSIGPAGNTFDTLMQQLEDQYGGELVTHG